MGIFKDASDQNKRESTVKWVQGLPRDGQEHVALWHVFSDGKGSAVFGLDEKATADVNMVLDEMRRQGLEVVTVRLTVAEHRGVSGSDRWDAAITYR